MVIQGNQKMAFKLDIWLQKDQLNQLRPSLHLYISIIPDLDKILDYDFSDF